MGLAARRASSQRNGVATRAMDADDEDSQFGVMTVVSCIPLVNWTAWVLPALQQPERAALYTAFAAVYAVPLLLEGFDIEGYTWLMLVLGAVHVQVERIAATEPHVFADLAPLSGVLGVVGVLAQQVLRFVGSLGSIVALDAKEIISGTRQDGSPPAGLPPSDEVPLEELQLKEFDRRMMAREAAKRQRKQQRQGVERGQPWSGRSDGDS